MIFLYKFLFAQQHLEPAKGAMGVPGQFTKSFVIKWASVPGAVKYEYVLSDNPNCFAGCSGDTRQAITSDTVAVEFNMAKDRWYYWITRVYTTDSTAGDWSLISSFITKADDSNQDIIFLNNPMLDQQLQFTIDWAAIPKVSSATIEIYDIRGISKIEPVLINKSEFIFRFEYFSLPMYHLSTGNYIVVFLLEGVNEVVKKRILVP